MPKWMSFKLFKESSRVSTNRSSVAFTAVIPAQTLESELLLQDVIEICVEP